MRYLLVLILSFSSLLSFSQSDLVQTDNAKKSLQIAQSLLNKGDLVAAKRQLKHTVKIKDDFAVAFRELGKVYLELEEYENAIEALESSFKLDEKLSRASFFECAEAHFQTDNIEMANFYYEKYKEYKGKRYANADKESGMELSYDLILEERKKNCEYIANMQKDESIPSPTNIGSAINSEFDDYLPTITSDGAQLVFTRTEKNKNENILTSELVGGNWSPARNFSKTINTETNEGMAKFETHGRAFYFAGCQRPDTDGGCDIYRATFKDGKVGTTNRVEGNLNSSFWDSQPSITCDGNVMYFASSRSGGQGGADIWMSFLLDNGDWSHPQNLGPTINTPGDEEAPFISSDGMTLYFSSNGWPGQGNGDLFIARKNAMGSWDPAVNMGYPFNSPAKELGIYVQGNGTTTYFSSARSGGNGGLDVYKMELPDALQADKMVHLEGHVYDEENGNPIATEIRIGREDHKWSTKSDQDGWFFICMPGDKAYSFQISEDGYEYFVNAEYLTAQDNAAPVKIKLPLKPNFKNEPQLVAKTVTLKEKRVQFFFGFDSSDLTDRTIKDLDALTNFLKKDADWKVEVVGYADNVGSSYYNQKLSEKRAKSIVDHLNNAGINIDQVVRNEGKGALDSSKSADTSRRVDVILRRL